jgi:2-polyprenyl-6-methoxyphenol hydroxylase-like FAD-dependent oxidoreductase
LVNRFVVVGAGPAGLSLALQLARAGHPVALVEASRQFSRQFRGDALMPCGQEALARMGLSDLVTGLPQRTLAGWSVWVNGRKLFAVAEPMGSLQPCRLVPQQLLLEALLAEALQEPLFQWHPGQAVKRLQRSRGRICGVELADGRRLEADLVVGCDGRQSLVRREAGIQLRQRGQGLNVLWFELPGPLPADLDGSFSTHLCGGALGSSCIGARGELQLAWLLENGGPTPQRTPQAWGDAWAQLLPPPLANVVRERAAELHGPLRVSVQVGLAERWHQPGLLLLGDAAHPMSPVRAQGINMALRDSLVAASLLSQATPEELDRAAATVQQQRLPEIQRAQALQSAEARQGHLVGHTPLLRALLAQGRALLGPVAQRVWQARQTPLREGLTGALPAAELSPQRTNSISW